MKKILSIIALLLIAGNSFGQYTPNSQLNYIKLLKTPPVGTKSDSLLVWNGTDKFVYMLPTSELIEPLTVDSISDMISYSGSNSTLFVKDERRGGMFSLVDTATVDNAYVFPATGKGSGYWQRQREERPLSRFYEISNDSLIFPNFNGSFIQDSDKATIAGNLMYGDGLRLSILGSSNAAGSVSYGFSAVYGEANGLRYPSGNTLFGLNFMKADPNFVPIRRSVYQVILPYDADNVLPSGDRKFIPTEMHYLTTTINPTLNYTIKQYGYEKKDSLTVYYLEQTDTAAAKFDIVTSLGTTSVNTYVAPLMYDGPDDVKVRLKSVTVPISPTNIVNFTINNINHTSVGWVGILGFAFGNGVKVNNFAVSSASLLNASDVNINRGITTDERFQKAFDANTNFFILQFVDARSTLGVTPEAFGVDLENRIKQIRAFNSDAVILLITNPLEMEREVPNGRENLPKYHMIMREVALRNNTSFFDLQKLFMEFPNEDVYYDTIHPTPLGHQIIGSALCASYGYPNINIVENNSYYTDFIQNQTGATQTASARLSGTVQLDNTINSGITPKIYLPITTGSGTGRSSIVATSISAGNGTQLSGIDFGRVNTSNYDATIWGYDGAKKIGLTVNNTGSVTLNQVPTTSAGTYDFVSRNTSTGIVEKIPSANVVLTAGTTTPITGDFQVNKAGSWSIYQDNIDAFSTIGMFATGAPYLTFQDKATTYNNSLTVNSNATVLNSENPTYKGLVGGSLFNKADDPLAYPQIDDVVLRKGTLAGSPITGDLELDTYNQGSLYVKANNPGGVNNTTGGLRILDGGSTKIETTDIVTNETTSIGSSVDKIDVFSDVATSKGVVGNVLFDKQNDPTAYAQIGDIGTGWATYGDNVYTVGSPFAITAGTTSTLPNNAATVINYELPTGVTSFYDSSTNKFTPENDGDYYIATIRFKAQTTAPTGGYFDFGIDIGGALGIQFNETKIFAKGAGIEHNFSIVVPCYTAATFVANGGLVKLTSGLGTMTVYDINYQFDRVHKSKL